MKKLIPGNFSSVTDAELITATLGSEVPEHRNQPRDHQEFDIFPDHTKEVK